MAIATQICVEAMTLFLGDDLAEIPKAGFKKLA